MKAKPPAKTAAKTVRKAAPAPKAAEAPASAKRIHSVIDLWIGEQLRHRRKSLGLPLQEVATACDISVSLLSQIERGLRSISLRTLSALAQELQIPLETLVKNTRQTIAGEGLDRVVVRAGKHPQINLGNKGILKENLTPPAVPANVAIYRAVIDEGGSTGDALFFTAKGSQVGYVIEGQLELFMHEQLVRLEKGDSFFYDGMTPRRWRNPGPGTTVVLWAMVFTGA